MYIENDRIREEHRTMRRMAILFALVAATTLGAAGIAFTQTPEGEDTDPYIVVLEESVENPSQVANGIEDRQEGFETGFVYDETIEGFSAEIPDDSVADVRNNRQVAYVERDKVVTTTAQRLPWGIDRIDADESDTVAGNGSGAVSNVNVYVIDTGVDVDHTDLNVVDHQNFHGGANTDCDGHGTHVAGTLAAEDNTANVVGAAPGAPVTGVRVLNCNGSGNVSTVIAGVDWVTANAQKPAVANMSLGGGKSAALDNSVRASVASGVVYSVSAGNDGENACDRSPARAGRDRGIVTTAATNRKGEEPRWSNFGRCVDLWAPGANVLSTRINGGTETMTGTSMATPHVGGAAALYLSGNTGASPANVENALKDDSERTGEKSKNGTRIQLVNAGGY
jgi:aqualysin 1